MNLDRLRIKMRPRLTMLTIEQRAPDSRAPPTMGISPLRTSQKTLDSLGSSRKG